MNRLQRAVIVTLALLAAPLGAAAQAAQTTPPSDQAPPPPPIPGLPTSAFAFSWTPMAAGLPPLRAEAVRARVRCAVTATGALAGCGAGDGGAADPAMAAYALGVVSRIALRISLGVQAGDPVTADVYLFRTVEGEPRIAIEGIVGPGEPEPPSPPPRRSPIRMMEEVVGASPSPVAGRGAPPPDGWLPAEQVVWLARPSEDDIAAVYPEALRGMSIQGRALLNCGVVAEGRLADCHVLADDPRSQGFGAAALTLVGAYRMDGRARDGFEVAGRRTAFTVTFRSDR